MASTPTPDAAVIAELPAITLALRQGGESACEAAAVQLHAIVLQAPADIKNSVCIAIPLSVSIKDLDNRDDITPILQFTRSEKL